MRLSIIPKETWFQGDYYLFDNTEIGTYPASDREQVAFLIFPITEPNMKEIREKNTKRKQKPVFTSGRKSFEMVEEIDDDQFAIDLLEYVLKDWKGIEDEQGNPLPCTVGNKIVIMNNFPNLSAAWLNCAKEVSAKIEADRKELEKK